jgi:signal peptidase I
MDNNILLTNGMEATSIMSKPENAIKSEFPNPVSAANADGNAAPVDVSANQVVDYIGQNPDNNRPSTVSGAPFKKGIVREIVEFVIHTVIMGLFGVTFIMQFVNIPSGSMLNTIQVGDRLIVNKFIFGTTGPLNALLPQRPVRRGDIIVFKYPVDTEKSYVKRVIGLPGETVELRGNRVFINGQELPETRTLIESPLDDADPLVPKATPATLIPPRETTPTPYTTYYFFSELPEEDSKLERSLMGQKFGLQQPFLVPPNHYFVLGDNRDNSQDSRYWGSVPREHIIGSATLVFWSRAEASSSEATTRIHVTRQAPPWSEQVRWRRIGTVLR